MTQDDKDYQLRLSLEALESAKQTIMNQQLFIEEQAQVINLLQEWLEELGVQSWAIAGQVEALRNKNRLESEINS